MSVFLTILNAIDTSTIRLLMAHILDDDLFRYFSKEIASEIDFPSDERYIIDDIRDNIQIDDVTGISSSLVTDMAQEDPYAAHAYILSEVENQVIAETLGSLAYVRENPTATSDYDYDETVLYTISEYIRDSLEPKWSHLSEGIRALYIYLLYGAVATMTPPTIRRDMRNYRSAVDKIVRELVRLDNNNLLQPPYEYSLNLSSGAAKLVMTYLDPPPLSVVEERLSRALK